MTGKISLYHLSNGHARKMQRTSVVIVNISLKDYVTDENDTLRSPPDIKRMVSVEYLPELIY